jgi:hypothetical protein
MSENKIRSLSPYIPRLTWTWARRAITYTRERSTTDPEVNRLVKLAADRGDPEAQWWMSHSRQIVTMAMNKPDHYSEDDLMRALYHFYLYSGEIRDASIMPAARWGHPDAILASVGWLSGPAVHYSPYTLSSDIDQILKKAAAMGSVDALKALKANLASHRVSIEERALNGCYDAAAYLTEFETGTGRDPELDSNLGKDCTANDALFRFLLIFSGLLHPKITQVQHLDWSVTRVIDTIRGQAACYQFGLCAFQMFSLIPERVKPLFIHHVFHYELSSMRAKEAVFTWTLVGHCLGVCHNMRKFIGEMIWADRFEWVVYKGQPMELQAPDSPSKRAKN